MRLLLAHPEFDLQIITSDELQGRPLAEVYPAFAGVSSLMFEACQPEEFPDCDLVFLAVPHTASLKLTPLFLNKGVSVVDLSADYRLSDADVYELWYQTPHTTPELLDERAFGLPELFPEDLRSAHDRLTQGKPALVACAGCYPTATSLAAAPALRAGVVDETKTIIADAISGVTGAGRKATARTHFCFANENLEAYGVGTHRHTPEIEQILGLKDRLVFTPHLAPLNRGLLSTVTLPLAAEVDLDGDRLHQIYDDFYRENPLVEVLPAGGSPKTSSVAGTDRAQVGVFFERRTRSIIALGAIDNLGKGAAGQAIQCANILCGFPETEGLLGQALPI